MSFLIASSLRCKNGPYTTMFCFNSPKKKFEKILFWIDSMKFYTHSSARYTKLSKLCPVMLQVQKSIYSNIIYKSKQNNIYRLLRRPAKWTLKRNYTNLYFYNKKPTFNSQESANKRLNVTILIVWKKN